MPKFSEAYAKNAIVRYVLAEIGKKYYGEENEFKKKKHWEDILNYFNNECCYCGGKEELQADHIIGMNIRELGFDCLGNVAPACPRCNRKKNNLSGEDENTTKYGWEIHSANEEKNRRVKDYMKAHGYSPVDFKNKAFRKDLESRIDLFLKNLKTFIEKKQKARKIS